MVTRRAAVRRDRPRPRGRPGDHGLLRQPATPACGRRTTGARSPWPTRWRTSILVDGLQRLDPGTPVVSEEAEAASFERRRGWRRFWLVDPLDGTKEFIKRRAEFTVNVALIEDGEPVLGVVLAPALELLYWAVKGEGAWREEKGGAAGADLLQAPPRRHAADGGGESLASLGRAGGVPARPSRSPDGSRPAARSSSAGWPRAGRTSTPASGLRWNGTWRRETVSTANRDGTVSGRRRSPTTSRISGTPASSSVCEARRSYRDSAGNSATRPGPCYGSPVCRARARAPSPPGAPGAGAAGPEVEYIDGDALREVFPQHRLHPRPSGRSTCAAPATWRAGWRRTG